MKNFVFEGVCTALVTPFKQGKIHFFLLEELIERQIQAGVSALVLFGTTGESATLSDQEKHEIMRFCVPFIDGRCKVLFGCGCNDTKKAVLGVQKAQEYGADGVLVVTPYYNLCTQNGLVQYYQTLAKSCSIPIVAYNVPSRTGVDILPETMRKIADLPTVVGFKDAKGDIKRSEEYMRSLARNCAYYSGDDLLNFPLFSMGANGCISVVSNLFPKTVNRVYNSVQSGKLKEAATISSFLYPVVKECFSEVNPITVKEALTILGYPVGPPRPPLTRLSKNNRKRLISVLEKFLSEVNEF